MLALYGIIAGLAFSLFAGGSIILYRLHRLLGYHLAIQKEIIATLDRIKIPTPITRKVALAKARRWKRSRQRIERLAGLLGLSPERYFLAAAANESEIARQLRRFDIDPNAVDIPPELEGIGGAGANELVLPPPNPPANGRNEAFFERQAH